MFGFIKHALHAVEKPFESAAHFVGDHWKTIAVIAASTLAFVAVTALTGGLGAPFMAAMLAGGFASGVTGYTLANLLDNKPVTLQGALTAGVVSGVITVATAGVGRLVAPALSEIAVPSVVTELSASPVGAAAVKVTTNAAVGAAFGSGQQVVSNAIAGRKLTDDLGTAAAEGGLNGALMAPAERFLPVPVSESGAANPGPEAGGRGVVGALEDLTAGRTGGGDAPAVGGTETAGTGGAANPVAATGDASNPVATTATSASDTQPATTTTSASDAGTTRTKLASDIPSPDEYPRGPGELGGDAPSEPTLPDKFQHIQFSPVAGDLFVDGARAAAVRQGQLGDCYLVASLASVADDAPHLIETKIRLTPEGTYEVQLTHPRTMQETTTTLTSALPMEGRQPIFAAITQPGGKVELWPALYEKAYAKMNGGYDVIGQGDSPAVSLTALTGKQADTMGTGNADRVWNQLTESHEKDWPTVAWTGKTVSDGSPVHANHAYTFLGVKEGPNGERIVQLRNPWGFSPGPDGRVDMPLDQFQKEFPWLAWSEVERPAGVTTTAHTDPAPIKLNPWQRMGRFFSRHLTLHS